jgi:hypothetical protein
VLQVLLSQSHRLRALVLLGRFLDMGPWAVDLALSVGIFPYVLKVRISNEHVPPDCLPILVLLRDGYLGLLLFPVYVILLSTVFPIPHTLEYRAYPFQYRIYQSRIYTSRPTDKFLLLSLKSFCKPPRLICGRFWCSSGPRFSPWTRAARRTW